MQPPNDDCDDVVRAGSLEAYRDSRAGDELNEGREIFELFQLTNDSADWWNSSMACSDAVRHGAWEIGASGDVDGGLDDDQPPHEPLPGGYWRVFAELRDYLGPTVCDFDAPEAEELAALGDCNEGCPLKDQCHGPLVWCDYCGDTWNICDDLACDQHPILIDPCDDGDPGFVVFDRRDGANVRDAHGDIVYATFALAQRIREHLLEHDELLFIDTRDWDGDEPCDEPECEAHRRYVLGTAEIPRIKGVVVIVETFGGIVPVEAFGAVLAEGYPRRDWYFRARAGKWAVSVGRKSTVPGLTEYVRENTADLHVHGLADHAHGLAEVPDASIDDAEAVRWIVEALTRFARGERGLVQVST